MTLQLFENTNWKVRVVMRDGEPWFVAKDVCECLDLANSRDAVSRLDDDEKGIYKVYTLGGSQDGDMHLSEKFYNWDELVEFVKSTHEIYEPGSGVSEFRIWTETEDFSDFSDYKK